MRNYELMQYTITMCQSNNHLHKKIHFNKKSAGKIIHLHVVTYYVYYSYIKCFSVYICQQNCLGYVLSHIKTDYIWYLGYQWRYFILYNTVRDDSRRLAAEMSKHIQMKDLK